jgi:hypothetical protein
MNKPKQNIYCDESCHLESQNGPMALGAVVAPASSVRRHNVAIRKMKSEYRIPPHCELKWTKISPAKVGFYLALVDYFFDQQTLWFRGLVACDKSKLRHKAFHQTHDDWYYKMYFHLLNPLLAPDRENRVYLDIKDTRGATKVRKLHEVLCNNEYDFDRSILSRIQEVRSNEIELLSFADIFAGALTYFHRGLATSPAKTAIVRRIRERSGLSLQGSSLLSARKFNLFLWNAREV